MENHIVNSFDQDLKKIRNLVLNMGSLVKDLVSIANHAIEDPSKSFVQLAVSTDKKINHFDAEIEHSAIHILALRQPMAVDLRIVISALKLAVILERMGDLAKKISHRIEYLPIEINPELYNLMQLMAKTLHRLLENIFDAYDRLDLNLAAQIGKEDILIDDLYSQFMTLLENEMTTHPENAKHLMNLLLIARNFERIGDYVTKISFIIHYIVTGEQLTSIKLEPKQT